METLTFEELPSAVKLLLDKVTRLEKLLDPDLAVKNGTEKSINVVQAAEFLNMAVQTLYGKVSRKEIPVNKQGKHLHFYVSELEEWLRRGRKRTVEEIKANVILISKSRI